MATTYTLVLAERDGTALGEIRSASARTWTRTLNGMDSVTFTLPLSDPVAGDIIDPAAEHLVKLYRRRDGEAPELVFIGPLVDAEAIYGPSGSVQVNAASPLWNLTHRLAGKVADGVAPVPLEFTDEQRGVIARSLITAANAEGETGIALPVGYPTTATTSAAYSFREVAEIIAELSAGQWGISADGFDFCLVPQEPAAGKIATFRIGPRNGADTRNIDGKLLGVRTSAIFEMGTGRDTVTEAREAITRGGMANAVWHVLQDIDPVVADTRTASITTRGRHEAVVRDDVQDAGFRAQLVDLHLFARANPRRVITFTPAPEEQSPAVPVMGDDYDLGDIVRLRVVEAGRVALNDDVRIYGIATSIDDGASTATHQLTLIPE